MAQDGTRVLCGPLLCDRSKPELHDLTPASPAILHHSGVKIAIITDHPVIPEQYLALCAGLAVREGLPFEEALRTITLTPAEICGISDRVGSITKGKDADLVLFAGDPLTVQAKPAAVFCKGKLYE
jgi:imidazolonepropionase-like amidohydrolase